MERNRQIVTVLGSEGLIGSSMTSLLKGKGYHVIECDILNSQLQDLRQNELFLSEYFRGVDFVYFLAFDVGGSVYLGANEGTFGFLENNTKIMLNTFGLLKKFEIPFIFASSQMSQLGFSPYGNLKLLGENYTNSLGGINARLWNVYGFEKNLEKYHVISDLIFEGLKTGKVKLRTDGQEKRRFMYVDDCCEYLYALHENYLICPRTVNIAANQWTSIKELAQIVKEVFNENNLPFEFTVNTNRDEVQKGIMVEPSCDSFECTAPFLFESRSEMTLKDGIRCIFNKMKNF